MRLLLSIELLRFGGLGPAVDQRCLQPLPGEPLAHPSDSRAADLQSIGYLGVGPGGLVESIFALVGLEQDARMGQLARRGVAASDQAFQPGAILPGEAHGVVPLPRHRKVSSCSLLRGRPHERRPSRYPRRNIAANQSCQDTSPDHNMWAACMSIRPAGYQTSGADVTCARLCAGGTCATR